MKNSLKRLRKARQLTLKALSEKSGIALSTINNFENGRSGMSQELLQRLAETLKTSASEILVESPDDESAIVREGATAYEVLKKVMFIEEEGTPDQIAAMNAFLDTLCENLGLQRAAQNADRSPDKS